MKSVVCAPLIVHMTENRNLSHRSMWSYTESRLCNLSLRLASVESLNGCERD